MFMKNWENATIEELDVKDTMYGGTKENKVDYFWVDGTQAYEAYEKTDKLS